MDHEFQPRDPISRQRQIASLSTTSWPRFADSTNAYSETVIIPDALAGILSKFR